jgi:hypothetical protein
VYERSVLTDVNRTYDLLCSAEVVSAALVVIECSDVTGLDNWPHAERPPSSATAPASVTPSVQSACGEGSDSTGVAAGPDSVLCDSTVPAPEVNTVAKPTDACAVALKVLGCVWSHYSSTNNSTGDAEGSDLRCPGIEEAAMRCAKVRASVVW